MNKAIFLDRDGTLNVDRHYLCRKEDFEFLPGVIDGLRRLQEAGFLLIIITNQSGIARGYYSIKDFRRLNTWMLRELKKNGVIITDTYFCPHLPEATISRYRKDCNCRKPKTGLFEQAILDHQIDVGISYAVGDKLRDCAICQSTACKGFLLGNNEDADTISQVQSGHFANIAYCETFTECVSRILEAGS